MKSVVSLLLFAAACGTFISYARAVEPGFIPLLDPDHTDGWRQCGKGGMNVQNGIGTMWYPASDQKSFGVAWFTKRKFADFVLKVEYRPTQAEYNSGLRLRFTDPGDDPMSVSREGYEISIFNPEHPMVKSQPDMATGGIAHYQAPKIKPPLRPLGAWNELEVAVMGQNYVVKLNGAVVNEFVGSKHLDGYIGLENHKIGPVQFRNVRVKELSAAQPSLSNSGVSLPPAANVTTHKADEPRISILSDESVNVTGWITAPLDVAVPEQIWENLNFLKEALRDEAARKPAATTASYTLGVRLCLKMLENLEERNQMTARAGGAAVLHQTSNLTQQNRDHLTWPQYALERDERAERQTNARQADRFMNGHIMIEWAGRAGNMRREIQALYAQFREALRQTMDPHGQAGATTTPMPVLAKPLEIGPLGDALFPATFSGANVRDVIQFFQIKSRGLDPKKIGLQIFADESTMSATDTATFEGANVRLADALRYAALQLRLDVTTLEDGGIRLKKSTSAVPRLASVKPGMRVDRQRAIIIPVTRFAGANLEEAFDYFMHMAQRLDPQKDLVPVIFSPELNRRTGQITLDLKDVPVFTAMRHAADLAGAEVVLLEDAFYLQPKK